MTDLEMTKLCAEAAGIKICEQHSHYWPQYFDGGIGDCGKDVRYDPLHDDAQAMALVKKFTLQVWMPVNGVWEAIWPHHAKARSESINRAIVECVAKMQAAKP